MDILNILDIIDSIISKISSYGHYILAAIVIGMVMCLVTAIYQSSQAYKPLHKKLRKGIIRSSNELMERLQKVIRKRAIYDFESRFEMYQDRKGKDRPEFIEYLSQLTAERRPLIFEEYTDEKEDITVYFTNPMFLEWLKDCDEAYDLEDFEKAVWRYFRVIDQQNQLIEEQNRITEENDEKLRLLELEQEEERSRQKIVQTIAKIKSKKSSGENKKLIVDRYNRCVKNIHDNEDHGLLPDRPQSMPISLYRALYASRVYGNRQIYRMIDDDKWNSLSGKGCYIVYNTFNGKHFIGKAENLYVDLKLCLNGEGSGNLVDFRKDLLTGHMFLVKLVPLSDSGLVDLDTLHEALCRSYKSFRPSGYNANLC